VKSGRDFNDILPFALAIGIAVALFLSIDESDPELLRRARIAVAIVAAFVAVQAFRSLLRWNGTRRLRRLLLSAVCAARGIPPAH
jgi:hypothetical protein